MALQCFQMFITNEIKHRLHIRSSHLQCAKNDARHLGCKVQCVSLRLQYTEGVQWVLSEYSQQGAQHSKTNNMDCRCIRYSSGAGDPGAGCEGGTSRIGRAKYIRYGSKRRKNSTGPLRQREY